jgi:hypothetical protein
MAAHRIDVLLEFRAEPLHRPFHRRVRLFGHGARQMRIIELQTGLHHVAEHQIRRVDNPLLFLQGRACGRDLAAIDPRVAARLVHFLDNLHR